MAVKACATFLRLKNNSLTIRNDFGMSDENEKKNKSQSVIRQGEYLITFIFDVDRRTQKKNA